MMELLYKHDIIESYNSTDDDSLFIDPLLSENQIGNFTVGNATEHSGV